MNIITKKENKGRLIDGIETILNMSEDEFEKLIKKLRPVKKSVEKIDFYYTTDKCEVPEAKIQLGLERKLENGKFIGRGYYGAERFTIRQIFEEFSKIMSDFPEDSIEYARINEIMKTRNIETYKLMYLEEDKSNAKILDKVFEILTSDEIFQKFLKYEENIEYFNNDGRNVDISVYLKYLADFFGNKDKSGKLSNDRDIERMFYIPDLEKYKARYLKILDTYNMDRYVNPTYEFRRFTTIDRITDFVIRKEDEPDWNINEELYKIVCGSMPENLSLEEKAMYIYCNLCKIFCYDEGYLYRDKLANNKYVNSFSKEHLEDIKSDSKITCWDFSRIFAKFINQIQGDIEAVVIARGMNEGHYLTGFYTDKVSVILEPINIKSNHTNDLMKAKNGIELEGIEIISDREGIIKKSIEKVYSQIYGDDYKSIDTYIEELRNISYENVEDNLELKLEAFIEIMKEKGIVGNEAAQNLDLYRRAGFFGKKLEIAYIGERIKQNNEEAFKRKILLRKKNEQKESLYLIDTETLSMGRTTSREIIDRINKRELVYEDERHRIAGIDREEKC